MKLARLKYLGESNNYDFWLMEGEDAKLYCAVLSPPELIKLIDTGYFMEEDIPLGAQEYAFRCGEEFVKTIS